MYQVMYWAGIIMAAIGFIISSILLYFEWRKKK